MQQPLNVYLLSIYLKKWSYTDNRIALNYSFCFNDMYVRNRIEMRIGVPTNLMNEIINHLIFRVKEELAKNNDEEEPDINNNNINLVNDAEVKRKLTAFLSKILKEFNYNKRSRGKSRMISTRSLDFFYNDFEYEQITDDIKFFVHLNRGVNKMNGELWENAVDDLTLALEFQPNNIYANKQMAKSLINLEKYKEAIPHLEIYVQQEQTPESLKELANAYIRIGEYKKAEDLYKNLENNYDEQLSVAFGRAQLAYRMGKGYRQLLDRLYKTDPDWFQEKLKNEWDFKLPSYAEHEECMWNAATAARYLGFDRPFDLTKRAFNDEIPSYFDSEKGTIRFVKTELDAWVDIMNRYHVDGVVYKIYKDAVSKEELNRAKLPKKRRTKN
ncbi:MAG: hypothetical protein GF313_13430 [Caldithrix sp.]|nr:hypothetical protein [Caldithrix sp.]